MFSLPSHVKNFGYLYILVTGGRFFSDDRRLLETLDFLREKARQRDLVVVIVQGGAAGADKIARQWAWNNCVRCITERAKWTVYGKAAGPMRNQAMLDKYPIDVAVAMPGGGGTANMVDRCKAAGIPVLGDGLR